ncbi:hypothetical protein ILUMI_26206 [Ignelater luminosus]|uniref:Uncharacterized protein n=1 Tax=Ignelater luminosus TaxID=2038154 RepID=A0A8K0FYW3_IGNLU|nr:hypothetical protein ILUMI_26206 [Ignelater luminosus]
MEKDWAFKKYCKVETESVFLDVLKQAKNLLVEDEEEASELPKRKKRNPQNLKDYVLTESSAMLSISNDYTTFKHFGVLGKLEITIPTKDETNCVHNYLKAIESQVGNNIFSWKFPDLEKLSPDEFFTLVSIVSDSEDEDERNFDIPVVKNQENNTVRTDMDWDSEDDIPLAAFLPVPPAVPAVYAHQGDDSDGGSVKKLHRTHSELPLLNDQASIKFWKTHVEHDKEIRNSMNTILGYPEESTEDCFSFPPQEVTSSSTPVVKELTTKRPSEDKKDKVENQLTKDGQIHANMETPWQCQTEFTPQRLPLEAQLHSRENQEDAVLMEFPPDEERSSSAII